MKSPLAVIFVTVALDLVGFGMVVPIMPLYAQNFGASGTQVAALLASYSLMQFVFAPMWGRLSDRIGRRPVLLASIAGNVVCLLAFGLARNYAWLLAARLGAGVFAANISVANAYVADITGPAERARGMGLIGAAFGIGFVIGPFIGGELSAYDFALPALVAAGLSSLNGLAAFVWVRESLPPGARRRATVSLVRERLQLLAGGRVAARLLLLIFLQVFGFSMLELALVLFTKAHLGYGPRESGRLLGYIGVVLALVQGGLVGPLARRLGEARLASLGLGTLALAVAAIPWTPGHGAWSLFALMTFVGFGQGAASPALSSLLSRRAAAHAQGATLGLGQSVSSLARVLGPPVAGAALDVGGDAWPFWVGGAILSVACAVAQGGLRPPSN